MIFEGFLFFFVVSLYLLNLLLQEFYFFFFLKVIAFEFLDLLTEIFFNRTIIFPFPAESLTVITIAQRLKLFLPRDKNLSFFDNVLPINKFH